MLNALSRLTVAVPRFIDRRDSWQSAALCTTPLILLMLLPTGNMGSNEEYYFQIAAQFWASGETSPYAAIQETGYHLFLTNALIGIPVTLFGYEAANILLRVISALALGMSFAWLACSLRLSALESLLGIAIFWLLGQELFGGEWILGAVEGKVFAYVFVFLALAQAARSHWRSTVALLVVATYFHFLVGGFWAVAACLWLWINQRDFRQPLKSICYYALAILPLVALMFWQRIGSASQLSGQLDIDLIYATYRVPHHIAPFSNVYIIWEWTTGIVLAVGLLMVAALSLTLQLKESTRALTMLVFALLCYLLVSVAASSSEAIVELFGKLYLFRPSSLTLLLAVLTMFAIYSDSRGSRIPVWMAAWIILPTTGWGILQSKVEDLVGEPYDRQELTEMISQIGDITDESEVLIMQPGQDGEPVGLVISRLIDRPTFHNFFFVPSLPADFEAWYLRDQFRERLFSQGCKEAFDFDLGALIVRNSSIPPDDVLDSCGRLVWTGPNYGLIAVDVH